MALAAQPEASTPIASVAGVFGQNAAPRGSIVDLFTPSQAGEGDQSDPTIEAQDVLTNAPETLVSERFTAVVTQPDAVVTAGEGTTDVVTQPDAVVTAGERFTAVVTQPDAVVTSGVVTQPDAVVTNGCGDPARRAW